MSNEKEITVAWNGTDYNNPYGHSAMRFCWLKPLSKSAYERASGFTNCRETHVSNLRREILSTTEVPRRIYRRSLLMATVERLPGKTTFSAYKKQMKYSVKVLNLLESKQGWSLTRVQFMREKYVKTTYVTTVVRGSAKWMRAPQLLSLYLLCLRLSRQPKIMSNIKTLKDLITTANKLRVGGGDNSTFKRTAKYWVPMMDAHRTLFLSKPVEHVYKHNDGRHGITDLFYIAPACEARIANGWAKVKRNLEKGK